MNGYERFLYWEGFRHGREWANSCIPTKQQLEKAERRLMCVGITPLTYINENAKETYTNAIMGVK